MIKKQLISIMLLCMCFICTAAYAQQADLYVEDAVGAPGSETVLSVNINNTEGGVAGFSFKIYLPDGFKVIKATRGSRLMTQNAGGDYLTTFQSAPQTDGSYMVLAYGGQAISGTEGEVAKITVCIPADTKIGDYVITTREVECSMGSAVTSTYTETTSVLTVKEESYAQGYTICTTPIATTVGAANTIVLNFAGVDENITDIEFDMVMPSCLSRTKSGRVTKAFEGADENRMYVSGTEGDHAITVNGNHVTIASIVDDEYKFIAGTSGALVNMYYTTATGTADGIYPIQISNIFMKNGNGDVLNVAPTTSYIKVGNPSKESLMLIGHITEEVNTALATETALVSVDMSNVISMDGTLTLVDDRDIILPERSVQVPDVCYNASISSSFGYKTLVLPFDWTVPAAFKAYEVTGVNNGELEMSEVWTVSANTPIILKNTGSALISASDVTIAASSEALTCGELIGTYEAMEAQIDSYVLQNHDGEVAFYHVEDVQPKVGAFRAYLKNQTSGSKKILINLGGTTAIMDTETGIIEKIDAVFTADGKMQTSVSRGYNVLRMKDGSVRKMYNK